MNVINKFLETSVSKEQDTIMTDSKGLSMLNSLFKEKIDAPSLLRLVPKIKQNQIWTIKKNYLDYRGENQQISHDMMVILTSDCENLDDEVQFVRGCPITPFIEMATSEDQICSDPAIIGFPFMIEFWNEQPMLVDILDKFVGEYYAESKDIESNLNEEQQNFREIEISNARFLNRSVLAFTSEMERTDNFAFSVDVAFSEFIKTKHMPIIRNSKPKIIELPVGEEYAAAAKTGKTLTDNDCIDFCSKELPFKIEIRKKMKSYVMTIIPKVDICLKNNNDEEINGISNSERIVFENLGKGLYTISSPLISKPITIRIK